MISALSESARFCHSSRLDVREDKRVNETICKQHFRGKFIVQTPEDNFLDIIYMRMHQDVNKWF
jgi:hypothetical protein